MTQKTNIYNTKQFNQLIQQLTKNYTIKVSEVLLPPDNISQHNEIYITTSKDVNFQGIPQNIQFRIKNEGYVNNWNSCMTFNLPIEVDFSQLPELTSNLTLTATSTVQADFVLLDNFLCLKILINQEMNATTQKQSTEYIRILQIPPSPAAWLDNVILQKNNKNNTPFNSYYFDIYRKQAVNNQLIDNDFTEYKQDQYAMVNQGHTTINAKIDSTYNKIAYGIEAIWNQAQTDNKEILLSSQVIDLTTQPVIEYIHQVEIPLAYFHPFFQMSGSSPLELLNDDLLLTFNFNRYLFSALYAFDRYKPFQGVGPNIPSVSQLMYKDSNNIVHYVNDLLKVKFTGIDNIKMNIYKDRVLKSRRIEPDQFQKLYITYRNSDKIQQIDFAKNGNPVLQNIIPKVNSLDIIQMSVYDPNIYEQNNYYQCLDYYIGYSNLFKSNEFLGNYQYQANSAANYGQINFQQLLKIQDVYYKEYSTTDNYTLPTDLPFITFGNVQIQIDNNNIIPYQYQSLQNIYQNNLSIYDINDNKQGINNQWTYGNWTKYFNTYLFKFDQSYGSQDELRSSTFQGLKTNGGNSNIYFELYNYNQKYPSKISYPSGKGFIYNDWINQPAFVEFIYYYTSLMMISQGDLIQVNEDTAEEIINEHKMRAKDDEELKLIDSRIVLLLSQMNKKTEEQAEQTQQEKEEKQIEQEVQKTETMPPL